MAELDVDLDPFQRGLKLAREQGRKFGQERYTAKLGVDRTGVTSGLQAARQQVRDFTKQRYKAKLGLDTSEVTRDLAKMNTSLSQVGRRTVVPKMRLEGGTRVITQLAVIEASLDRIDGRTATVRVDIDGGAAALAMLRAINAAARDRSATVNVNTRGGAGAAASSFTSSASSVTSFTSSVGGAASKMQLLIALGAALAPALIPAFTGAAAAAGALVAILGTVGLALGALGAGIIGNVTGVLGAQKDLEAANQAVESAGQAAAAAQNGVAAAARGVQAAEQGLAQARQAAAAAVANAERSLESAVRNAKAAQEALNEARKTAAERLADYRDQLKGAALDEDAAELAVRRARQTLADVLADPNATKLDKDEARQALAEAMFQLEQVREQRDKLQDQAKKDRAAGVAGSDEVKAARERLAEANRAVADAERALADARASGAQQVAAAQEALNEANRAAGDAAKSAGDAQAALAAAQADQAAAMAKVSTPAAIGFLNALDDLKGAWQDFLGATQGSSLGVVESFLGVITAMLPKLVPLVNTVGPVVGDLFDQLAEWVESPSFDKMIAFLIEYAPGMIRSIGEIAGNLGQMFGGITEAFAPFAQDMLDGLVEITDGWADWAGGLSDSDGFNSFMDFVKETGPQFLDTLGAIGGFFRNVGEALSPLAMPMLELLESFFGGLADMDPTTLAIVIGISGAILALTVAPVAGTALALVGLAAAFAELKDTGGPVGDVLTTIGEMFEPLADMAERLAPIVRDELADAWAELQPTMQDFADFLSEDFQPKWDDFWIAAEPVIQWLIETAIPLATEVIKVMIHAAERVLRVVGGLLEFLTGVFTLDAGKAFNGLKDVVVGVATFIPRTIADMWGAIARGIANSPVGRKFGELMDDLRTGARLAKEWVLDRLVRGDDSLMGRLSSGFETALDAIGRLWDGLVSLVGSPVKIVVDYLYNQGIRKVVNAIPGVPGELGEVDTSGWPSVSRARGGVLPGYSPGVDDHTFVSKTAGVLNLSGGEGILIPQATKQLGGAKGIDWLNDEARRGRLRQALAEQSHASGGIVIIDGEKMSRVAAAQLAVAERAAGYNMPIIQGSYEAPSDYSGSSHTGGGVMDTGPGDFTSQAWLRKAGFAAWGRNFAGAATAGSGPHVHSVSLWDPAARGNTQAAEYLAGGDGLAGSLPDYGPRPAPDPELYKQVLLLLGSKTADTSILGLGGGNPFVKFAEGLEAVKTLVTKAPGWIKQLGSGAWGDMMKDMGKNVVDGGLRGWVNGKLPGSPMPKIFDTGGWLEPGAMAINMGSTPEPVLTDAQWKALSDVALEGRGGLSTTDVDRIVAAIEDNRSVAVSVSSTDEIEQAFDALGDELRKRGRR